MSSFTTTKALVSTEWAAEHGKGTGLRVVEVDVDPTAYEKGHIEGAGEEAAERHPVATGPFKFVEHVRGDRIVYEAVENHWRATPHWKRLVFLKVPEPATRMAMLRAGSVDVIEIGGEYVDELKKVGVRTLVRSGHSLT